MAGILPSDLPRTITDLMSCFKVCVANSSKASAVGRSDGSSRSAKETSSRYEQITGRWNDRVKADLKIEVERCGCDAAFRGASSSPLALLLAAALTCAMIGANR